MDCLVLRRHGSYSCIACMGIYCIAAIFICNFELWSLHLSYFVQSSAVWHPCHIFLILSLLLISFCVLLLSFMFKIFLLLLLQSLWQWWPQSNSWRQLLWLKWTFSFIMYIVYCLLPVELNVYSMYAWNWLQEHVVGSHTVACPKAHIGTVQMVICCCQLVDKKITLLGNL